MQICPFFLTIIGSILKFEDFEKRFNNKHAIAVPENGEGLWLLARNTKVNDYIGSIISSVEAEAGSRSFYFRGPVGSGKVVLSVYIFYKCAYACMVSKHLSNYLYIYLSIYLYRLHF